MLPLIFINNIKINNMENKQIKCYCGHTIYCDCSPLEEPKQETLEEAAEKYANMHQDVSEELKNYLVKAVFQDGANWQQERMYSEEDMINFAFDTYCYISELMGVEFNKISENKLHAMYNFEQFKKK